MITDNNLVKVWGERRHRKSGGRQKKGEREGGRETFVIVSTLK